MGIKALLLKLLYYFFAVLLLFFMAVALASLFQYNYRPPATSHLYPAPPVRSYSPNLKDYNHDSLLKRYGQHKSLPQGYELQALLALQHYPQLRPEKIHFVIEPETLPLAARPSPWTMLLPKAYWEYNIIISNQSPAFSEDMLFAQLPFNAQVGILGHELAHTLHYQDKTALEMVLIGIGYGLSSFRKDFEQATDKTTVAQGLGWQLYDFAKHIRSSSSIAEEEKQWMDQYYLNDSLITAAMQEHPAYSVP